MLRSLLIEGFIIFMAQNRVFYSLLERVGGQGKYQLFSLAIWSLLMMVTGASLFFNAFLFYQGKYQCSEQLGSNCQAYVCSLPPTQRSNYVKEEFFSLVSQFGDYRCDNGSQLNLLQSFIYVGGILGVLSGASLSQILTIKKLLIISVLGNFAGILLALFGPSLQIASVGLFINMAAVSIELDMILCYITQAVSQDVRSKQIMIAYVFEGFGATLNGPIFYLLQRWDLFLIVYILIPVIVCLCGLIFYIEETPFDLVTNYSPEESLVVLNRIAMRNGRQNNHKIRVEQLRAIRRQYDQNQQRNNHVSASFLDLFRYDSLRTVTILSIIIHFLSLFQFSAPQLALKDYSESIFFNGCLIGFSELLGSILCYFVVNRFKRKKTVYITQAASLCVSLSIFLFIACDNKCSFKLKLVQSFGIFFFRALITVAYNSFYLFQCQVFPNQIRSIAIQTTSISSFLAIVLIPEIITIFQKWGISIVLSFSLSCFLVIVFTIKLPQTFGTEPPQIIQQLKYEHHQTYAIQENYKIKQR